MDNAEEPIADPEQLRQVRAQARKVYLESVVAAGFLTAVTLLLPR